MSPAPHIAFSFRSPLTLSVSLHFRSALTLRVPFRFRSPLTACRSVFQFVVGFFSFLFLLCCDTATASFRAALVPVHSSFGITTFFLAVATCLTGLTEKVLFTIK